MHIVLRDGGTIVGAAPAYARTHSMGEFIFDQGLAQAATGMGRDYYPKLSATLPFTPSPGYRFLVHPDYDEEAVSSSILDAMEAVARQAGLHSLSFLFADPEWTLLPRLLKNRSSETGWLEWLHQFFLWENPGLGSFDDYVGQFTKNQRRSIRRERESLNREGIRIEIIPGTRADRDITDLMYDLYEKTNRQFGPFAAFFLNREWFTDVQRGWGERLVYFAAYREGESLPLALSLVVEKDGGLTGRYWGTREYVPNLHFELCYYAPLEYAIQKGLARFDPGMGSPHKARRGFGSRGFSTWHRFFDDEVHRLFASVLPEANDDQMEMIQELDESVPFKREFPGG